MELMRIETPRLFTGIRERIYDDTRYGRSDNEVVMHYCTTCGQVFKARYDYHTVMGWDVQYGKVYSCPLCFKPNIDNYWTELCTYRNRSYNWLPTDMTIKLIRFNHHIVLAVQANCIRFTEDGTEVTRSEVKEEYRFDIKAQKVVFRQGATAVEVGNPYKVRELIDKSLLRFVTNRSSMWKEQKGEVKALLKCLRDCVRNMLMKEKGYKLSGCCVPARKRYGLFLVPLANIAYRLACQDAANLELLSENDLLNTGWNVSANMPLKDAERLMEDIQVLTRSGLSSAQAIARAYALPDTRGVRRLLTKVDVLKLGKVRAAFDLFDEPNYFLYVAKYLLATDYRCLTQGEIELINDVREHLGARTAARLTVKSKQETLRDAVDTYNKLCAGSLEKLWALKPTAEQMHDTLVALWEKQETEDYDLEIPEAVVRRLELQKDTLRFLVPTTSWQLLEAGRELHNCVGTYAGRVLAKSCSIVLMADDKGKLKVCLEVVGGELRQAKLINNRPVRTDGELNAAVLEWAKEAKLKVRTSDVAVTAELDAVAV